MNHRGTYRELPVSIHVASLATEGTEGLQRDDSLVVDSLSRGDRLLLLESSASTVGPVICRLVAANEERPAVIVLSTRELVPESLSMAVDPVARGNEQDHQGGGRANAWEGRPSKADMDRRVSFSSPLTGVEIAVTQRLAELRRAGVGRPWLVVDTLSPLFGPIDSKAMVRFLHSLSNTVDHYGGIGCYVANEVESRDDDFERLKHLSDGTLEIRTTGTGREVRRRGFEASAAEWRSIGSLDQDPGTGSAYSQAE
jgi:hypothetical protein